MKKYIKLFIFIMIIIFSPNVFADSYNVSSTITSPSGGSSAGGKYQGTELNGSTGPFNINTRYNGTLTNITYNLIKPIGIEGDCFWSNMTYTVTMEMATSDWRNRFGGVSVKPYSNYSTNWSSGRVTYVSMKKIYFTFKIPSSYTTCESSVVVNLSSSDLFTPFTGETNWNLSKITLSDTLASGSSAGSSGGTPTPTPTPDISGPIIDNQNQNTNSLIDNQNQNTSDIIENNNENTNKVVDAINNNSTCFYSSYNRNLLPDATQWESGDIEVNGLSLIDSSYYIRTTPYIKVKPNTAYYLNYDTNWAWALVEYSSSNQVITYNTLRTSPGIFTTSPGTNYIKITTRYQPQSNSITPEDINTYRWQLNEGYTSNSYVKSKGSVVCVSKDDETTEAINKVNDSINNDNIDSGVGGGFFSDFQDNQHGLTGIITAPLTAIERLTSSTCQPLQLPIPFTNSNVSLPCMTQVYNERIPTIYNIWKVVSFGIIAYFICVDIFHIVKGFKDPESDKVEVLDL